MVGSAPVLIAPFSVRTFVPEISKIPPPDVPGMVIILFEASDVAANESPQRKVPVVTPSPREMVPAVPSELISFVFPIVLTRTSPDLIFTPPLKLFDTADRLIDPSPIFSMDPVPLMIPENVEVPAVVVGLFIVRLFISIMGFPTEVEIPDAFDKVITGETGLGVAVFVVNVSAAPAKANVLDPVLLMLSAFNVYGAALLAVRSPVNVPRNLAVDFSSLTGAMSHAVASTVVQSVVPTTLLLV